MQKCLFNYCLYSPVAVAVAIEQKKKQTGVLNPKN